MWCMFLYGLDSGTEIRLHLHHWTTTLLAVRTQHTDKVSVKVPVDEWLCRKFEKLNLTVQEGYPSRLSKTAGLTRDHQGHLSGTKYTVTRKTFPVAWTNKPAHLKSCFPWITNCSLPSAPASRPVSQETVRKLEQAACDQSYMTNKAAGLSCCLTKVHEFMYSQLKVIMRDRNKGKSSSKLNQAAEELDYLVTFNHSITQAMACTM